MDTEQVIQADTQHQPIQTETQAQLHRPLGLTRVAKLPPQKRFSRKGIKGFSKLKDYKNYEKLGEGTFGVVFKANRIVNPPMVVAIKKIIERKVDSLFPLTAFREMEAVKALRHPNIVDYVDFIFDDDKGEKENIKIPGLKVPNDIKEGKHYYMVFPYMHSDLAGVLMNPRIELDLPNIKSIMFQLFKGLDYLHRMYYIHRDIKTANILLDKNGIVKIADLGLIKTYRGNPVTDEHQGGGVHGLTPVVMTRWYRAPECVFQYSRYGTAVDMWSAGCVFGEMFEKRPIMKGDTDINQGYRIFEMVGWPTQQSMPGYSTFPLAGKFNKPASEKPPLLKSRFLEKMGPEGFDLMEKLLTLDPQKRITASMASKHEYFLTEPLPYVRVVCDFEESHEADKEKFSKLREQIRNRTVPASVPRASANKQEPHYHSQRPRQSPFKPVPGQLHHHAHKSANEQSSNQYFKQELPQRYDLPKEPSHFQQSFNRNQLPSGPSVNQQPEPHSKLHMRNSQGYNHDSYDYQQAAYNEERPSNSYQNYSQRPQQKSNSFNTNAPLKPYGFIVSHTNAALPPTSNPPAMPSQPQSQPQPTYHNTTTPYQREADDTYTDNGGRSGFQTGGRSQSNNPAAYTSNANRDIPRTSNNNNTSAGWATGNNTNPYGASGRNQSQYDSQQSQSQYFARSGYKSETGDNSQYTAHSQNATTPLSGSTSVDHEARERFAVDVNEANLKFNENHPEEDPLHSGNQYESSSSQGHSQQQQEPQQQLTQTQQFHNSEFQHSSYDKFHNNQNSSSNYYNNYRNNQLNFSKPNNNSNNYKNKSSHHHNHNNDYFNQNYQHQTGGSGHNRKEGGRHYSGFKNGQNRDRRANSNRR
ncbi:hypothetical protein WICPIJ_003603 [Wickerhamomyces pijperi]|uniref:Serine/threonine-protein kinase BUR1 n=1 Tax=Wickerhamomyces pijperi TaxID=599730 RepID=A0A9P8Q737_WICPI|nr:hypothetical protein WICPIJ_003603 [Wickerhamomyces pijperi]